jgi:hypothetical protein
MAWPLSRERQQQIQEALEPVKLREDIHPPPEIGVNNSNIASQITDASTQEPSGKEKEKPLGSGPTCIKANPAKDPMFLPFSTGTKKR